MTLREDRWSRDYESPEYFRRFDDNVGIYWLLNYLKTQETSFFRIFITLNTTYENI